jgi:uncharacterized protein (DUF433 family)
VTTTEDVLTAGEAAIVAGVPLKEVHRAVDEHILPRALVVSGGEGRRVRVIACPFIHFYFITADKLVAEERRKIITTVYGRVRGAGRNLADVAHKHDVSVHEDYLTVDLRSSFDGAVERLRQLEKAKEMVVEDPEILGGTPVVRGTRIPVHDVAASAKAGTPRERILKSYPRLPGEEAIDLAVVYADARPLRGRRRKVADLPGAKLVRSVRVPLRRP